jgi:DNA-binding CsgD family transcriptional regulator
MEPVPMDLAGREGRVMGERKMEEQILGEVVQHPTGIWIEQIARNLNISRQTVSKYVGQLEARNEVRVSKEGQMKRVYPTKPITVSKRGREA